METHVPCRTGSVLPATRQRWRSRHYPRQIKLLLNLATSEGCKAEWQLSWPSWLVTRRDGIPVPARRRSPIPVLTGPDVGHNFAHTPNDAYHSSRRHYILAKMILTSLIVTTRWWIDCLSVFRHLSVTSLVSLPHIWSIIFRFVTVSASQSTTIRYDTIRDAILMCARKPTWVSLIYRTQPTAKKCKNRKTKSRKQICSEITVNSPGNPCSEYWLTQNDLPWNRRPSTRH